MFCATRALITPRAGEADDLLAMSNEVLVESETPGSCVAYIARHLAYSAAHLQAKEGSTT